MDFAGLQTNDVIQSYLTCYGDRNILCSFPATESNAKMAHMSSDLIVATTDRALYVFPKARVLWGDVTEIVIEYDRSISIFVLKTLWCRVLPTLAEFSVEKDFLPFIRCSYQIVPLYQQLFQTIQSEIDHLNATIPQEVAAPLTLMKHLNSNRVSEDRVKTYRRQHPRRQEQKNNWDKIKSEINALLPKLDVR
eukprot:PhF_6_TR22705/c0_g1_i1/m.32336